MKTSRLRINPWVAVICTLSLFSALQALHGLAARSLWHDELRTAHKAYLLGLPEMLAYLREDAHPPLYYLLVRLWGELTPKTTSALRLFSWLFYAVGGCWVIAHACDLARSLGLKRPWLAGGLAALMMFCSPFPIHFSSEAKGYSLMIALLAAALWLRSRQLGPGPNDSGSSDLGLAGLSGLLACAALVHYYAFFYLLALVIWDLGMTIGHGSRHRARILRAEVLAGVPALLWITHSSAHLASGASIAWIKPPDAGLLDAVLIRFLGPDPLLKLLAGGVVVLFLLRSGRLVPAATAGASRLEWPALGDRSGLAPSGLMVVMVVLISFAHPFAHARYFIILLPSLAVFIAILGARYEPRRRSGWCLLLISLAVVWAVAWRDAFADHRKAALDGGSNRNTNYRALSLSTRVAVPRLFVMAPRRHDGARDANASDFVLQQEGLLPQALPRWVNAPDTDAVRIGRPERFVLGSTGTGLTALPARRRQLQGLGYLCTRRPTGSPRAVAFDCMLPQNGTKARLAQR